MKLHQATNILCWSPRDRHKYLQLPLIPVDQFLAEHPEFSEADEDALTIARIDHEHAVRLALEEQRQGLLKKKQGLIADNKKRKDDLANLDKDLEKFIDVWLSILDSWTALTWYIRLPNLSKRHLKKWCEIDIVTGSRAQPKRIWYSYA